MSENLVNILKILVEKQGIDCLYNSQTWRYVTTEKVYLNGSIDDVSIAGILDTDFLDKNKDIIQC